MIAYEKALEIIEFQKQQIEDLTNERDRLKDESENSSEALALSNERRTILESENNEMTSDLEEAYELLYGGEEE